MALRLTEFLSIRHFLARSLLKLRIAARGCAHLAHTAMRGADRIGQHAAAEPLPHTGGISEGPWAVVVDRVVEMAHVDVIDLLAVGGRLVDLHRYPVDERGNTMRILNKTVVEDCVDAGETLRYRFDEPLTRARILRFGELGRLDLFADLPRPFFRITGGLGLRVKGTEGESTCLVVLPNRQSALAKESFERLVTEAA